MDKKTTELALKIAINALRWMASQDSDDNVGYAVVKTAKEALAVIKELQDERTRNDL
jgi:hypothetical protein